MPVGDFRPYSKEQQLTRGPKRGKPTRAEEKANYSANIESSRNPTGQVVCHVCNKPCKEGDFAMDHVKPRSRGGTAKDALPAHPSCHDLKHKVGVEKAKAHVRQPSAAKSSPNRTPRTKPTPRPQ